MSLLMRTRLPEQNEYAMILSATSLEGVKGSIIVRAKGTEQEWAGYVLAHLAIQPSNAGASNRNQAMAPALLGCLVVPTRK